MESLDKNQSDAYYSDSAIRERCVKMVNDYRIAEAVNDARFRDSVVEVAEYYFQYIKTGVIPPVSGE